jgi:predicted nucleic acid-binding protein
MVILDTSFLIAMEKKEKRALRLLDTFEKDGVPLRIPGPVWIEYLHPMEPKLRRAAAQALDAMALFEPVVRENSEEAAQIQFELKGQGKKLGLTDLQIAAVGKFFREPVATNDGRFSVVGGLEVLSF